MLSTFTAAFLASLVEVVEAFIIVLAVGVTRSWRPALVIGLLQNKLRAYPASLVVLSLFIAYQVYRYSYTHSMGLVVLTVFDVIVMFLIRHEYRLVRRKIYFRLFAAR